MRLSLFMLGICGGIVGVGTRVEAQNYPWCALYSKGDGADLSCGFLSFEQCMASARTTSLGAKTSINAAPMIPTRKRTTALPGVRGTRTMKLFLFIFGILGASAAQAQNAPWCLRPGGEGGSTQRCTYASFEQCLADRTGNGFCIQNSTYQASTPSIRRR